VILTTKTRSRVVRPMSEEPLEYPRTFRTDSRLANKIKKVGRKWTGCKNLSHS